MKKVLERTVIVFYMLLAADVLAEDFDFVAKVENVFVFTDDYENTAFINKAQVKFEGNPITLSGCNPNHIVFSTLSSDSNSSTLYSTVLAAYMSGKSLRVSVKNDPPLFQGNHCTLRWLTPVN